MDIEKNLNYKERRVVEQLQQVLNLRSNFFSDDKNVSELFSNYRNVLDVSQKVKDSLNMSEKCYSDLNKVNEALKSLEKNCSESFLIVNFKAEDHMFSSVIRKIDNAYSVTIVNKAARPLREKYEECNVDESNIENLSGILKKSQNRLSALSIYVDLEKSAQKIYNLRVEASNQKGLNCFLKEPEAAIKYAIATSKNSIDELKEFRNISKRSFLRCSSHKKTTYKPKWPALKTVEAHERFYKEVADKNPSVKTKLALIFGIYKQNKEFRKSLNNGISRGEAFEKAFCKYELAKTNTDKGYLVFKYSCVSIETAIKNQKDIVKILKNDGKSSYVNSFNTVINIYKQMKILDEQPINPDQKFRELQSLLKKSSEQVKEMEKTFPFLMYQINGDICNCLLNFAYGTYQHNHNHQEAIDRISYAIDVNPNSAKCYWRRGGIFRELGMIEKSDADYQKSLRIRPFE